MFIMFMVSSAKTNRAQKIKAEGNSALEKMEHLIRNSKDITSPCSGSDESTLDIVGFDEQLTTLQILTTNGTQIASSSSGINNKDYFLTSEDTDVPDLNFVCYEGYNGSRYVEISFGLKRGEGETSDSETVLEEFSTGVSLRN